MGDLHTLKTGAARKIARTVFTDKGSRLNEPAALPTRIPFALVLALICSIAFVAVYFA